MPQRWAGDAHRLELPAHPLGSQQGPVAAHRPAHKRLGKRTDPGADQRDELLEEHRQGVAAVRPAVPVAVGPAVNGCHGDRYPEARRDLGDAD